MNLTRTKSTYEDFAAYMDRTFRAGDYRIDDLTVVKTEQYDSVRRVIAVRFDLEAWIGPVQLTATVHERDATYLNRWIREAGFITCTPQEVAWRYEYKK